MKASNLSKYYSKPYTVDCALHLHVNSLHSPGSATQILLSVVVELKGVQLLPSSFTKYSFTIKHSHYPPARLLTSEKQALYL